MSAIGQTLRDLADFADSGEFQRLPALERATVIATQLAAVSAQQFEAAYTSAHHDIARDISE